MIAVRRQTILASARLRGGFGPLARVRTGADDAPMFMVSSSIAPAASDDASMLTVSPSIAPAAPTGEDDPVYQAIKRTPGFYGMSYADWLRLKREVAVDEKYRDPRYAESGCNAGDDVANLGYLYVLPSAEEESSFAGSDGTLRAKLRVARMRKKVDDFGKDRALKQLGVRNIYELSRESLIQNVSEVVDNYQAAVEKRLTPKELQAFADKIGVPADEIVSQAPSILSSLGGRVGDAVKELAPSVWAAIGPQVMRVFKALAEQAASLRSGADAVGGALGDATAIVPIFGAMLKVSVALLDAAAADKQALCVDYIETQIKTPLSTTMKEGFPYPWHVMGQSVECASHYAAAEKWVPTPSMEFLSKALTTNLKRFDAIDPIGNAVIVASTRRWWALANQLMGYGDVAAIFGALGNDARGGLIASDEQVVLVAAPIAASYGLPIWDFARALYDQSLGWRDPAVAGLLKPEPMRVAVHDADGNVIHGGCLAHCSKWDPLPSTYDVDPTVEVCKTAAANAMQLQWGVLARDAFALAEKAKRGEVSGVTPIGFAKGSEPKVPTAGTGGIGWGVPVAIGGATSALLLAFGASIPVVAAPLGIAALWLLATGASKSVPATPPGEFMVATGRVPSRDAPILALAKRGETQVRVGRLGPASAFAQAGDRGLCPYDLHHADASRYKCWEELLALEDHVVGDPCKECMSKHVGSAIKFLREARSLDDGSQTDIDDARKLAAMRSRLGESLEDLRALRKSIGERIRVRALLEPSGHEDVDCGCGEDHDQSH